MPRWQRAIGRLRRRATVSSALERFGRLVVPAAFATLALLVAAELSPWPRYFAPWLGGLLALALVGSLAVGWARGPRSEVYLAKWIDLESQLEDRLASAVEWSRDPNPLDPFRKRCIDQLELELGAGQRKLVLPRTRPRRLAWSLVATVTIAAAVVIYLRRPTQIYERDAKQRVVLPTQLAEEARARTKAIAGQGQALADPELERMASDLSALLGNLDGGKLDRQRALAELDQLRLQAQAVRERTRGLDALGDAEGGALGPLARALAHGDTESAGGAMTRLAEAVAGGELSDEEMAQLRGALAQLAAVAGASNGELAGALASADRELGTGDRAAAARHLLAASPKMKALHGAMAARSLAERTTETLDLLARATRAEAEDLGRGPGSPARRPGEPPGMLASGAGAGGPDSSRGSSIGTRPVGEPNEDGARGPELPIAGQWRGKVLRQLFESTSAKSPSDALRLAIVEHQRVVEDRFQHDEVPEEYQEAVRAYFALLSARESSWMSIKK